MSEISHVAVCSHVLHPPSYVACIHHSSRFWFPGVKCPSHPQPHTMQTALQWAPAYVSPLEPPGFYPGSHCGWGHTFSFPPGTTRLLSGLRSPQSAGRSSIHSHWLITTCCYPVSRRWSGVRVLMLWLLVWLSTPSCLFLPLLPSFRLPCPWVAHSEMKWAGGLMRSWGANPGARWPGFESLPCHLTPLSLKVSLNKKWEW